MTKRGAQRPPKKTAETGSRDAAPTTSAFPIHEHIGEQLKNMFEEVVTQPIPEKLLKLLEELEGKSKP
jgi:hypothetical protein